jgi:hypothetical protein
MNITEARFEIDRILISLANGGSVPLVRDMRFFPAPCDDHRSVLACAELVDGGDIQVMFETAMPVDHDNFDENAMCEMFFAVPSGARH